MVVRSGEEVRVADLLSVKPSWFSFRPSRSSTAPSEKRSRKLVSIFFCFSYQAQFVFSSPADDVARVF